MVVVKADGEECIQFMLLSAAIPTPSAETQAAAPMAKLMGQPFSLDVVVPDADASAAASGRRALLCKRLAWVNNLAERIMMVLWQQQYV